MSAITEAIEQLKRSGAEAKQKLDGVDFEAEMEKVKAMFRPQSEQAESYVFDVGDEAQEENFQLMKLSKNRDGDELRGHWNDGSMTAVPVPLFQTSPTYWRWEEDLEYALGQLIACKMLGIQRVLQNDPVTILFWEDGDKTITRAIDEDFSPEKGIYMGILKHVLGGRGYYPAVCEMIKEVEVKG